jgi:hypothetical protein
MLEVPQFPFWTSKEWWVDGSSSKNYSDKLRFKRRL